MSLTTTGLAGMCLILWGLFHWLGIFAKTRVFLALLAALALGGFLGRMLVRLAIWLQHMTGVLTGWLLGASVPGALFLVLAILLIHDLHPRHGATRVTSYVAFGAGTLLVAGVAGIPALAPVTRTLMSLPATVAGFVNSL